ncbi:MAG: tRNA lysidine(34) synthetase TilS [Candidatus Omnitrophica bacterium]|nr:tRNA lysidine(34) synthetase TilS [Candidatus Omnitrophota bacterium]
MRTFLKELKTFSHDNNLFASGEKIIVGVSGGPDSVALLHGLYALRHDFSINLHVAHLNHGIRKEAVRDQTFVEQLCDQLKIPCTSKKICLKKKAQSLEEAAREERFRFLIKVAKTHKAKTIALGHTKDDLAETILMRLLRGTGLSGMRSILPKREIYQMAFIRPMLTLSRINVVHFLKENNIKFCTDLTNRSKIFTRNKIRMDLIPLLEKEYNPNIKDVLAHLSIQAATDYDFLKSEAETIFLKISNHPKQSRNISLDLKKLAQHHPAIQRIVIRLAIQHLSGNMKALTFSHIKEIECLINNRPSKSIVHLPKSIAIQKKELVLIFSQKKKIR